MRPRMTVRLDILAIAALLAITAIPVEVEVPHTLRISTAMIPDDCLANVLGYVPLGLVSSMSPLWTVVTATAVSATAETSQMFSAGRYASPVDLGMNMVGALLGCLVARLIGFRWQRVPFGRQLSLGAVAAFVLLVAFQAFPGVASDLRGWSRSAQWLVAKIPGDNPWFGDVLGAAILPRALSAREIAVLHPPAGGAQIDVRNPVVDQISASGEFTLLLHIRPAGASQFAAIVSYGKDAFDYNFSLDQEDRYLTLRINTPVSGRLGTHPVTETPPIIQAGREMFVAVTYDGRVARIYRNGVPVARNNVHADGRLAGEFADLYLGFGAVSAGVLLALVAAFYFKPRRRIRTFALCLVAGISAGLVLYVTGAGSSAVDFAPWLPVVAAGGGLSVACATTVEEEDESRNSTEAHLATPARDRLG